MLSAFTFRVTRLELLSPPAPPEDNVRVSGVAAGFMPPRGLLADISLLPLFGGEIFKTLDEVGFPVPIVLPALAFFSFNKVCKVLTAG